MKRLPKRPEPTPEERAEADRFGLALIALVKRDAAAWLANRKRAA